MRSEGAEFGLQPIQMEALYYLSICNRYSDTPMGVTEYLGQTKGTVSQSLKVLEKKGLISKHADSQDKRLIHLRISDEGKALLGKSVPPPFFLKSCELLSDSEIKSAENILANFLRGLQQHNEMKPFGVCRACRNNVKNEDGSYFCKLTNESLSKRETELLCREYENSV